MEENVKSSENKFFALLPKILPIAAIALAALSLLFTFLVGVTASGAGTQQTYYFYHYFESDYVKSISEASGALREAIKTQVLYGLLFSLFALIAVLTFAGLTCYRAVRKYAFGKNADVEKFAVCTYFAYIAFSAINYALNASAVSVEGVTVTTGYSASSIAGLVIATLAFGVYVAAKVLSNLNKIHGKLAIVDISYTAVRMLVLVLIIALVTLPVIKIKADGVTLKSNFIGMIAAGSASPLEDKLSSLVSSASVGYLVVTATILLYTVLLVQLLFNLFDKKKNDAVFYVVGFALCALIIFFSVLVSSFYTDAMSVSGKLTVAIPITVFVLSLFAFALAVAYHSVLGEVAKSEAKDSARADDEDILLEVKDLTKHFVIGKDFFGRPSKTLKAVDGVSFKLKRGKTLGIVGESGCGKTTMGRTILRLHDVTGGDVWFKGQKISDLRNRQFDKLRPSMQMIFQDPYASLSPRLTVGEIIGEAARQHKIVSKSEYHDYIIEVMKMCGLQPHYFERYPHEFSGGQRQRICIARALALKPELVICDEPVSALDVSIQAQIINMLIELRKSLGLTYVFISHDLSVVKHISDEVGVMYLGTMVEYGSKEAIFGNTLHPYTRALFSAVPVPNPHVKMNRIILKGDIPSPVNPPKGCKFHTRCENCMEICSRIAPPYKEIEEGHFCACHLYNTPEETEELLKQADLNDELEAREAEKKSKARFWEKWIADIKNLFHGKKDEQVEVEALPEPEQEAVEAQPAPEQVVPEPAEEVKEEPAKKPSAKKPRAKKQEVDNVPKE